MRRIYSKKYFLLAMICMGSILCFSQKQKQEWKSLFNGKDLSNWDTWMRAPNMTGYNDSDRIGPIQPMIGLNNDPLKVFTVHDGILHISGEVWGAITTKKEYGNYHLRFVTKWGEKKYFPKDNSLRDGGVLFHCTDGFDFAFKCWMRSMEMQLQETEIGDFFNVRGGVAAIQTNRNVKTGNNQTADQYDPSRPPEPHPGRVYRSGNFESPKGEWTVSEMVARHADAVFIVNGFVVNRLFNIFRADLNEQVTKGKLQFQSEGAEHFYRSIEIRPISFIQCNPKLISPVKELILATGEEQLLEITNEGEAVELIAAELIGKEIEQYVVKLPPMPMILKKGGKIALPVTIKAGTTNGNKVKLKLETVLGPVPGYQVELMAK